MFVQPGPESIEPGRAPGGYIVQMYGVADGRLLVERELTARSPDVFGGAIDADVVLHLLGPDEGVCIVLFDGDSGERCAPLGVGQMLMHPLSPPPHVDPRQN